MTSTQAGSLTTQPKLLLTYKELAASLSVCVPTLYRWVKAGKIRPIKLGNLSRFDPEDVVRRLKKGARRVPRQD